MSNVGKRRGDRQLHTLERWKRLELESAQAEHVACQTAEHEKQSERERVKAVIESAQEYARSSCDSGTPLSPISLLLASTYSELQRQELAVVEAAVTKSQEAVQKAHSEVVSRSEHLFGIEKLRERRRNQASRDAISSMQSALDEHALLKLSSDEASNKREF